jgi:C4-dicarboxylate-specific signal transduction histidine kinase
MRRLLPAVLLIPLGLAWTRSQEMVAQLYGPTVALSLTVALAVGLLVAIVWNTGALLHQADLQRRAAEGDLLRAYDELETRVAQRTRDLSQANEELRQAMERIRTLSGLLPICAWCKKVRDDNGYWSQIETYLRQHSQAEFTHGICPECAVRMKALR